MADRFYDAMSLTWGCSKVGSPLGSFVIWSYSKKAITQPSRSNLEGSTKNFESVRTLNPKPLEQAVFHDALSPFEVSGGAVFRRTQVFGSVAKQILL